ncbi:MULTISPECIES: hypothetical protein [unclassified Sphingomonas]|uniref:hypothetical protein n=1 Tax=unclassified Sphingomonas TaxID=196159 RepID=UPI00092A6CBE|nr:MULTISPECIES: hypothetical protein [unclassified Sphingomonas]MBN8849084.1 hypothetical protein [Sphingomonas sp.]MBS0285357.1 hypothetical protein [Pseudomonadota bacterium]OJV29359.1 MAG: hypothetical protein BGO24_03855 [Sphingomonas sp. 67-36]
MERRRRAFLLIAAALLLAGIGERRPLISLDMPSADSVVEAQPVARATINLGRFGLSLLVRLNDAR